MRYVAKFVVAALAAGAMTIGSAAAANAECSARCAEDAAPVAGGLVPNLLGMGLSVGTALYGLTPKAIALIIVPAHEFPAFDNIITRESGWDIFALNPTSGAYGLPQALPAHKMASHGPDWMFNPVTQIRWAYDYMNERYGSPTAAWAFWQANGWY
ncbi:transglycosylase SLT domain-containing protein [Nocardia sp. CC227C]|uniref:aggregation-promoting factor C-terminal-like domain-containing protein n=1 Tax=Nocardia sp. CC227C TaxID=3044562 RepID=UPI00278C64A5|nr:transglycosylase SLT domain-containing protein [Nocardia sp. CC227C]